MESLRDWLDDALGPDYEVEREIARGGMGAVFLARDLRLAKPIAIKVLLPELATATGARRFVREARLLAGLNSPHVVPVHSVGEESGLFYYTMDYMEGTTLWHALQSGPLSEEQVVKLGRDLLDALETVHTAGIVHRDIKPDNIFLVGGRAVLADFGIAIPPPDPDHPATTQQWVGTPPYMPPEHLAGEEVTARTDLYAVAMVLYEALTGRRWRVPVSPDDADWSGVRRPIRRVLTGALQPEPADRFADAQTFRRALWRTRSARYRQRTAAIAVATTIVGIGLGVSLRNTTVEAAVFAPGELVLGVAWRSVPLSLTADVRDSILTQIVRALGSAHEIDACPADACPGHTVGVAVDATASEAVLDVTVTAATEPVAIQHRETAGPDRWRELADTLGYRLLRDVYFTQNQFSTWLPRALIPSGQGFAAWLNADRLLRQARWTDARRAFEAALANDSSCVLCSFWITEVQRWHNERPGPAHLRRVFEHRDGFPPHYRAIVDARRLPLRDRIASLRAATERWGGFYLAWSQLGTEQFHRGALAGLHRRQAIGSLQQAVQLFPEHGPSWELLTWAAIAEGEADIAGDALARLDALTGTHSAVPDLMAVLVHAQLRAAYGLRFGVMDAAEVAGELLSDPRVARAPAVGAGPRLMLSFDAPEGALQLAALYDRLPQAPDNVRFSADVARFTANTALGRYDAARQLARVMEGKWVDAYEFQPIVLGWEALLAVVDPDAARSAPDVAIGRLRAATIGAGATGTTGGARWLADLLRVVSSDDGTPPPDGGQLDPDDPYGTVLRAAARAREGDHAEALALLDGVRDREVASALAETSAGPEERENTPDPFFRAAVHMLRARWMEAAGQRRAAIAELRWHENFDQYSLPTDKVIAAEFDWMFGTWARWERARLHMADREGSPMAACGLLADVIRLWSDGDAPLAARADSARDHRHTLACDESS